MFLDKIFSNENQNKSKRKIENLVFLIIILVITIIVINTIWSKDSKNKENYNSNDTSKTLADEDTLNQKEDLETKLEKILSTIKDVGQVKVFINYSESSSFIPLYDEKTTTSNIAEEDTSGGSRNTTQTESEKQVVFSENSGTKEPISQKTTMPIIQGAIITAEGAKNGSVKTDITNAVQAVTALSLDKIQVFEMKK